MSKVRVVIAALTLSAAGIVGLMTREGFSPVAYPDPVHGARVPTLGYGSTEGVRMGDSITPVQAAQRTLREVRVFESQLKQCVSVPLYQHEFDAYVELIHNIGSRNFCTNPRTGGPGVIVRHLNAGDYAGACEAILQYRYAGGVDCSAPGNRRTGRGRRSIRAGYRPGRGCGHPVWRRVR